MTFQTIYPTKNQRISEARRKSIKNPKTREEAEKNKEITKQIEKIQEVF